MTMAGTDGHVLLAYRETQEQSPVDDFSVIIPNDIIAGVKAKGSANLELNKAPDDTWRLFDACTSVGFVPVDGTFPDWRRVFPRKVDGTAGSFSFDLLARFSKAAREMGSKHATLHQNGPSSPALVKFSCSPDLVGVIMPKRDDIGEESAPDWI